MAVIFILCSCAPDLKIRAMSHSPVCPQAKDKITFNVLVENAGSEKTGKSELSFQISNEKNPVILPVPELKPHQTYIVTREIVLGRDQAYANTVILDPKNQIQESDETNNESIEQYGVGVVCWRVIIK